MKSLKTNMEHTLLNSGDSAQQQQQQTPQQKPKQQQQQQQQQKHSIAAALPHSKQIFIHSRSYGPKPGPAANSGSNNKYQNGRKSGGGIQMASGHMQRGSSEAEAAAAAGHSFSSNNLGHTYLVHNGLAYGHRNHIYTHGHEQEEGQLEGEEQDWRLEQRQEQRELHEQEQRQLQLQLQLQLQEQLNGQSYGHGDSLAGHNIFLAATDIGGSAAATSNMPFYYRHCSEQQPGLHANLNDVHNVRSWSGWDMQQQQQLVLQQQQLQLQQHQQQQHHQHFAQHQQQLQQQQQLDMQPQLRSHQLNVSAPSFTPASARGVDGARRLAVHLMPSQSQPQLQTSSQTYSRSHSERGSSSSRRQQMPDLFQTVLKLMRDMNRSVSYPEIIGMLSIRLQRLPVELKRHIPHTLHGAVANGYLRKDGNYYTLLSEQEQKEIMKRNQEAAKRAKELEKEPLSWRIR